MNDKWNEGYQARMSGAELAKRGLFCACSSQTHHQNAPVLNRGGLGWEVGVARGWAVFRVGSEGAK